METYIAIMLTQIPIAVAIFILAYESNRIKKELIRLLEKLVEKNK